MPQQTILVVDDEEDIRVVLTATLESKGYRVLAAPSAVQAMKVALNEIPDLVITDVMMPGESGFSLCTKLKQDPSTKDIPVIFLTVLADEAQAVRVGAAGLISKPYEEAELLRTVAGLLKPSDRGEILRRGLERLRVDDHNGALEQFREVIAAAPQSNEASWARYYAGQIQAFHGNRDKAKNQYTALLAEDPSFWRAHNRLAELLEGESDLPGALGHYRKSLELNPNQPDVGSKLRALGD